MTDNPTFHARMMSIQIPKDRLPASAFHDVEPGDVAWAAGYKMGHRDARHAAAEIATEADEAIAALNKALDRERAIATSAGKRGQP